MFFGFLLVILLGGEGDENSPSLVSKYKTDLNQVPFSKLRSSQHIPGICLFLIGYLQNAWNQPWGKSLVWLNYRAVTWQYPKKDALV